MRNEQNFNQCLFATNVPVANVTRSNFGIIQELCTPDSY